MTETQIVEPRGRREHVTRVVQKLRDCQVPAKTAKRMIRFPAYVAGALANALFGGPRRA